MFLNKFTWGVFGLVILALAIGLTPRIPVGTIEGLERVIDVRGEDVWILFLAFIWIVTFFKLRQAKIEKPPLFLPILFWVGVGFFSLLINWFLGNVSVPRGFFYFTKELQFFFVYFFTFFHIRSLTSANLLVRVWIGIGLANIAWVVYQLFTGGRTGEYGTSALNEWGVFPTGSFFLILFIFLFNWWLYSFWRKGISAQKEYLYLGAILSIILGILGALSKTVFLGFFFALIISIMLYVVKEKTLRAAIASILLFLGVSAFTLGAYFLLILPNLESAERLKHGMFPAGIAAGYKSGRIEPAIKPQTEKLVQNLTFNDVGRFPELREILQHFSLYMFGHGKGAVREAHNQYLRVFIEVGIAGSIAFLALIISIFATAYKGFKTRGEPLLIGLSAGVITATAAMLFMSLATEPFIVAKLNMTYWFFLGLTMAVLHGQKDKTLQKI